MLVNASVRISRKTDGGTYTHFGSGVFLISKGVKYVLTATHCLNGVELLELNVEYQEAYNGAFSPLRIDSIVQRNEDQDWALLQVELESEEELVDTKCSINFRAYPY